MKTFELSLLYRDACNYKTSFKVKINDNDYPEIENLTVGDSIEMGEYNTPEESDFFNSTIHPHFYNYEFDCNLLKVVDIKELTTK